MARIWLLICAVLMLGRPVGAADIALVVDNLSAPEAHQALTQAYSNAGFEVVEGQSLDRAELARLIARIEARLEEDGRLVLHLTGRMVTQAGLTVFLPDDVSPDSRTQVLTGGVPLALLLEMAAARPGRNLVSLGVPPGARDLRLAPPDGVLVLSGPASNVRTVILEEFLEAGRRVLEIDAEGAGVRFDGMITSNLTLLPIDEILAAPPPEPLPDPAAFQNSLTPEARAQIQTDLTDLGYATFRADGDFDNATKTAIENWQRDSDQPQTGFLTEDQVQLLADAAAAERTARATTGSAEEVEREAWDLTRATDTLRAYRDFLTTYPEGRFAARARERVETLEAANETAQRIRGYRQAERDLRLTVASVAVLERRLDALGLVTGPSDGRLDRQTRRAIATFQAQRGLTPTGYLDSATIQRLILAGNVAAEQ